MWKSRMQSSGCSRSHVCDCVLRQVRPGGGNRQWTFHPSQRRSARRDTEGEERRLPSSEARASPLRVPDRGNVLVSHLFHLSPLIALGSCWPLGEGNASRPGPSEQGWAPRRGCPVAWAPLGAGRILPGLSPSFPRSIYAPNNPSVFPKGPCPHPERVHLGIAFFQGLCFPLIPEFPHLVHVVSNLCQGSYKN